jgi:hypothetical protein
LYTYLNVVALRQKCMTLTEIENVKLWYESIGLYHPLDGIANPKYKLLCFLTTIFLQRDGGTSI